MSGIGTLWVWLLSAQICLFTSLLGCAIAKIIIAWKRSRMFMAKFFILLSLYTFCQLAIEIEQLAAITVSDKQPYKNANMVLGINICCIILDLHLLLMLNVLWEETSSSIVETVEQTESKTSISLVFKQIVTLLWLFCYIGYFIYLCSTQQLAIDDTDPSKSLSPINKKILYGVCQSVSGILLLLCLLWQTISWLRLQQNIEQFKIIIKKNISISRVKLTFWSTSIFNLGRTLFIVVLAILSSLQLYHPLITCLNIYVFTSCIPISLYLIGFKFEDNEGEQLISPRETKTRSSKKSHSHETQLSCRDEKTQS